MTTIEPAASPGRPGREGHAAGVDDAPDWHAVDREPGARAVVRLDEHADRVHVSKA